LAFQLGFALLDACVLSVLSRGDTYGYILTQNIKEIIDVSETTLYPVLRRLQKESLLSTYDESFNGRNRRYYRITESGKRKLAEYIGEWTQYKAGLDKILIGVKDDE